MENTTTPTAVAGLLSTVTLSKFKYFAGMSEETNAFTATVHVAGETIGTAENRGHGGCTFVRFNNQTHALVPFTSQIADAVDKLVDAKVNEQHNAKFILKMRRKARETTAYITADCSRGQYVAFKKGVMVNLNAVTAKPGFLKFVSDMTDAEILSHFTANA